MTISNAIELMLNAKMWNAIIMFIVVITIIALVNQTNIEDEKEG